MRCPHTPQLSPLDPHFRQRADAGSLGAPVQAGWQAEGTRHDGLKPKPRDDRGQPRSISPETLDRAEALKRQQPRRSSRSIVNALRMDSTQPIPEEAIAPRTLRRQMAYRNATTSQLLAEQRPKPYRRFERTHFGDLWQADAMHGPKLPDPANPGKERQVFLFAWLDDHTRLVPHAQFYWNEQLPRLEDCFKRAMLRYGRPLSIYVDRAKVHVSKQLDTICATLGIQRILGTPYYPEGRGKIERFFQFVQSDFLPRPSTHCPCSTSRSWPGSRSSTTPRSILKPGRHRSTLPARRGPVHPARLARMGAAGRAWYDRARAAETETLPGMYERVVRG